MLRSHNDAAERVINEGDEVILFMGYTQAMRPIIIKSGDVHSTREGFWDHDRIIGRPFGSRIVGRHRNNADIGYIAAPFLTVLRNSPELWTQALPHRTQIIVQTDISVIIAKLGLRPGCTVAEAGTGSGSLTHSLARAVAPTGKVFTFDFHRVRVATARDEFKLHGMTDVVVSNWRDVCVTAAAVPAPSASSTTTELPLPVQANADDAPGAPAAGYGLPAESVDAAFLDVPCPWEAVANLLTVVRSGSGAVCSYSPCIEQSQRFCDALRRSECFYDIHTVEALAREYVPIFASRHEKTAKRRQREETAVAAGMSAASVVDDPMDSIKGFTPQATGRGHTAYLTFARRRRKATPVAPSSSSS